MKIFLLQVLFWVGNAENCFCASQQSPVIQLSRQYLVYGFNITQAFEMARKELAQESTRQESARALALQNLKDSRRHELELKRFRDSGKYINIYYTTIYDTR
jgi:hypothetical protein